MVSCSIPSAKSMPLLILDRDGVLNARVEPCVGHPADWHALPGAIEALARLNHAGWRVVLACHEPAVTRGQLNLEDLHRVHNAMLAQIHDGGGNLEALFVHTGDDPSHPWSLPNPGLFVAIERRLHVPVAGMIAAGASSAFIEAAQAAGVNTVLIAPEAEAAEDSGEACFSSLAAAVAHWLAPTTQEIQA